MSLIKLVFILDLIALYLFGDFKVTMYSVPFLIICPGYQEKSDHLISNFKDADKSSTWLTISIKILIAFKI